MAALGLIAAPFANSLLLIALAIAVFYIAYFIYFTPYMALYPDLVDDELAGRAQGSVGAWREVGLGWRWSAAACSSRCGGRCPSCSRPRSSW